MPAATAPVRVPRRSRGSLSSSPNASLNAHSFSHSHSHAHAHAHGHGHHAYSPQDEIAHLTLAEVRDRLARNERVLSSALFSTSPTARTGGFGANGVNGNGPSMGSPTNPNGGEDPVRTRLLAVRSQLRAREAELLADSVGQMDLSAERPMARSPPTRSAKANALAAIRQGEAERRPSHVSL